MRDEILDASGWKVRRGPDDSASIRTVAELAWEKAKLTPERVACYFDDEPPITGGRAIIAYFMPGNLASMP